MAKITPQAKADIMRWLAQGQKYEQILKGLEARHGITVVRQALEYYNPASPKSKRLSKHLREIYETARQLYLSDLTAIPESHKAVRVRMLAEMANDSMTRKNYRVAADLLEQIAKETGNVFSNRHEVTGPKGQPIQHAHHLSDAEVTERLSAKLTEMARNGVVSLAEIQTQGGVQ